MKLSKKIANFTQTHSIRATAQGIKHIDLVPSKYVNCSELFLSHNSIKTLGKIDQFHLVSRLMLEYNDICNIEDLDPLKNLSNLTELRLDGNPVCGLIFWDLHTIDICKSLKLLNGKVVRRTNVKQFLYIESELIEHIYHSEIIKNVLSRLKSLRNVTPQKKEKLLEFEITNLPHNNFATKIRARTPSKNKNLYMNYLKKKCIKQHSIVDSLIPFSSESYVNHHNLCQQLSLFTTDELFHKQSQDLIGLGYQAIGLYTEDSFTKILRDKYQQKENVTKKSSRLKTKSHSKSQSKTNNQSEENDELFSLKNSIKKALIYANVQFPEFTEEPEEENESFAYSPRLSIQNYSDNYCSPIGYNPKLRRATNTFFEIMPRIEEEEDEEECEVQIQIDLSEDEEEEEIDLSQFQNNSNSSSERSVGFENQLKSAIDEEDKTDLNNVEKNNDSDSSKSSFELLNAAPLNKTIPLPQIPINKLNDYTPKFLENSRSSAIKKFTRFSSDEYKMIDKGEIMAKIAGIPNSFLGMKFYLLWRKRFNKRVNRRVRRNLLSQSSDIANSISNELSSQAYVMDDQLFGNTL